MVSVADLLQTDDLFQLGQPHELPELPDLDHLPGWMCCDVWEMQGSWTDVQRTVARESMRSQAARLRNHPSVAAFLIFPGHLFSLRSCLLGKRPVVMAAQIGGAVDRAHR